MHTFKKKRIAAIAAALAVVASGATAAAIATTQSEPPAPVVDAARSASAQVPTAADAVPVGPYSTWLGTGHGGDFISVYDAATMSEPLTIGCSGFEPGSTTIAFCGGIQQQGKGSLFVGRAAPAVARVEALYAEGEAASVDFAEGIFVLTGPPPVASDEYGAEPAGVVAFDASGSRLGSSMRSLGR